MSFRAVSEQAKAEQPSILLSAMMFCLPTYLLTYISYFGSYCSYEPIAQLVTDETVFFYSQAGLYLIYSVWLLFRYPHAFQSKTKQVSTKKRIIVTISVAFLWFCWYFHKASSFMIALGELSKSTQSVELLDAVAEIHTQIWSNLAYGDDIRSIFYLSAISLIVPLFESVFIFGLFGNYLIKRLGAAFGWVATSFLFLILHIPTFGLGTYLIPLFLAGFSYMTLRMLTGSIISPTLVHIFVNIMIFIPKWYVAYIYFNHYK